MRVFIILFSKLHFLFPAFGNKLPRYAVFLRKTSYTFGGEGRGDAGGATPCTCLKKNAFCPLLFLKKQNNLGNKTTI